MRNFKNALCLAFDKKEALSYEELMINMLSVSPDDTPVIGRLKHFPNVYLNIGHGQRSSNLALISAKILSEQILDGKAEDDFLSPKRFKI